MPGPLNEFIAAVHPDLAAWSLASVVSSTLLVVAYTLFPDVRRTPGWQFLYSSLWLRLCLHSVPRPGVSRNGGCGERLGRTPRLGLQMVLRGGVRGGALGG